MAGLCSLLVAVPLWCGADPVAPPAQYVEFDFAPLPQNGQGRLKAVLTLHTTDKDISLSEPFEMARPCRPASEAETIALFLTINKFKAEVVDKTKVRVYGRIWNEKLIPATRGAITCPDLLPNELPKVKNAEQKG
jgi:hypothetical protein